MRATRELGELTPAYRNLLLNTLMAGSVSAYGLTLCIVKVGEALVRATRELGELTPAYRNLLLN